MASGNGKGQRKKVNLALQGGGAHGAFTWGVVEALLDDGRLDIEGISGTSAGAVNACLLSSGLARSGPAEAKKAMGAFWRKISRDGGMSARQRAFVDRLFSFVPVEDNPFTAWMRAWTSFYSPYDFFAVDLGAALKDLIDDHVDFAAIQRCTNHQVYVSATNVHTGKLRVFPREKLTPEVVLASACLPQLFKAVEIDGVPYWDGGYMGNPALFPFFKATSTEDVLIVQINPLIRRETPRTARDIANRMNEITFNSSLLAELRAIDFVTRLIDDKRLPHGTAPGQYRRVKVHRVNFDGEALGIDASSKTNTDYDFFLKLKAAGEAAGRAFLKAHYEDIGVRSTIPLAAEIAAEWG